jgi:hypothetical protein
MKGTPLQIHLADGNAKTGFEGFTVKHRNAPQSYFCRVRKYKQGKKKKNRKLFLHFLQFLNDFCFKKTLKNVFYCANDFFFIIQNAKKYNNNNNNNNNKPGQKIRTGDIVVAVFVLYRCAVAASTLHAARHDTTRLRRRPTFSIIFFGERRAR